MHELSSGVYSVPDSFQLETEPRLVVIGHWDILRPNLQYHMFGGEVEDELVARLIAMSQAYRQWVAVTPTGFALHLKHDLGLPRPLPDDVASHLGGSMPQPKLDRFPLHSPLAQFAEPVQPMHQAYDRLIRGGQGVQTLFTGCGHAITLSPLGLARILIYQR